MQYWKQLEGHPYSYSISDTFDIASPRLCSILSVIRYDNPRGIRILGYSGHGGSNR